MKEIKRGRIIDYFEYGCQFQYQTWDSKNGQYRTNYRSNSLRDLMRRIAPQLHETDILPRPSVPA